MIISRFYKIVREIIASVAYHDPFLFLKAEEDPADPQSGEVLVNSSPILQDFVNDSVEAMRCKPKVRQIIFDALFCFRGWGKFGFYRSREGGAAPYKGSDVMVDDFTYMRRVRPEDVMPDPLTPPEEFYDARFVIERMFVPLRDVLLDKRFFDSFSQLSGLAKKEASATPVFPTDEEEKPTDDTERETLETAHRLSRVRKMYEIHDREGQRRIVFIEGLEEPIEEVPHPFLEKVVVSTPDPANGKALLARPTDAETGGANVEARKKFLIEGGLPYYSLAFDTCDGFYGDPVMAYDNPIQNAIFRSVSRRLEVLDRFKSLGKITKAEAENNPDAVQKLKTADHGDVLELENLDSVEQQDWGHVPGDQIRIEGDLRDYEAETIRTTADLGGPDATGKALSASVAEVNRELMQEPVEGLYLWIARNTMSTLSAEQFAPTHHLKRVTSPIGAQRTTLALRAWHLRGRFNISIAAGSMNVLYEQLHADRTLSMVQMLRGSPHVDELELDKYVIRAHGEIDPAKVLKDDANTDAAKAAETENLLFIYALHDPGVVPGEDHDTHINLQSEAAIQAHPQFGQIKEELQQMVLQIAAGHVEKHQQMQLEEGTRLDVDTGGPPSKPDPQGIYGQVQSSAQKTQDVVSKEAEDLLKE